MSDTRRMMKNDGGPLASWSRSPGRESTQRLCTCLLVFFSKGKELSMSFSERYMSKQQGKEVLLTSVSSNVLINLVFNPFPTFFCNFANLFSYFDTFLSVGLTNLPLRSFTAMFSSLMLTSFTWGLVVFKERNNNRQFYKNKKNISGFFY